MTTGATLVLNIFGTISADTNFSALLFRCLMHEWLIATTTEGHDIYHALVASGQTTFNCGILGNL